MKTEGRRTLVNHQSCVNVNFLSKNTKEEKTGSVRKRKESDTKCTDIDMYSKLAKHIDNIVVMKNPEQYEI